MARAVAETATEAGLHRLRRQRVCDRPLWPQLQPHHATFADFEHLRPCAPADLLVCSDVLHYLPTRELARGLPALAELCGGVAFIEAFAREDEAVGDDHEFKRRPAAFYTTRLRATGLRPLGSHCWLSPALAGQATALELPA